MAGRKDKRLHKSSRSTFSRFPTISRRCCLQNSQKSSASINCLLSPSVPTVRHLSQPRSIHFCTSSARMCRASAKACLVNQSSPMRALAPRRCSMSGLMSGTVATVMSDGFLEPRAGTNQIQQLLFLCVSLHRSIVRSVFNISARRPISPACARLGFPNGSILRDKRFLKLTSNPCRKTVVRKGQVRPSQISCRTWPAERATCHRSIQFVHFSKDCGHRTPHPSYLYMTTRWENISVTESTKHGCERSRQRFRSTEIRDRGILLEASRNGSCCYSSARLWTGKKI